MVGRPSPRTLGSWLVALTSVAFAAPASSQAGQLILATTTSTRDTGLLDSLLPIFEHQSGYSVKVIAVGSGQALAMGRRGDADLVLSHAPEAERALVDSGYFVRRRLMMHNEFLLVGPATDPAGVRGERDPVAAIARIAERHARFVSRGDQSGTHQRELLLWKRVKTGGLPPTPGGDWYIESGQGMGATLLLADEKHAYTLTDIGTYLAWRSKLELVPIVEGDDLLFNVYHVLELNPKTAPRANLAGGRALADFFVAPETQRLIGTFGKAQFGRSLFVPDAGTPDRW